MKSKHQRSIAKSTDIPSTYQKNETTTPDSKLIPPNIQRTITSILPKYSTHDLKALQRTIGNRATTKLITARQTKQETLTNPINRRDITASTNTQNSETNPINITTSTTPVHTIQRLIINAEIKKYKPSRKENLTVDTQDQNDPNYNNRDIAKWVANNWGPICTDLEKSTDVIGWLNHFTHKSEEVKQAIIDINNLVSFNFKNTREMREIDNTQLDFEAV